MLQQADKYGVLRSISFGQRVAEEEADLLVTYFVETDQWIRLFRGDIDVIYGPKGSGKSALYSLLLDKSGDLFDRGILLVPAENPRGATAFRDLAFDPPASEREFVSLWKLYIASLLHNAVADFGNQNAAAGQLEQALVREGLVKGRGTLASLLQTVRAYITGAFRPKAVEGTINIDPITQLPQGFTGKITFSEPGAIVVDPELRSVDKLLELANSALSSANVH